MQKDFEEFLIKEGFEPAGYRKKILKAMENWVALKVADEVNKRIRAFEKTPAEWFDHLNKKIDRIYAGMSRIEMAPVLAAGAGDMAKSVYDTNDNGVVDNSEKLEGKTLAQVQDHLPKAHGNEAHTKTFIEGAEVPTYETDPNVDNSLKGITLTQVRNHTPKAHASSHEEGGSDALNPANIGANWNKLVNKPSTFPPSTHAASHESGGADEINVTGLRGELADPQKPKAHGNEVHTKTFIEGAEVPTYETDPNVDNSLKGITLTQVRDHTPKAHAASHEEGGSDALNPNNIGANWNKLVNKPSTFPPSAHAASHQSGGSDEIDVTGLSGELADPQKPKAHADSHKKGGSDELDAGELAGGLGAAGQVLKTDGNNANWSDDVACITFIIDGGGSAITTGEKGHLRIPFACEIQSVTLLADQSGSIQIDIWKDTYANFPPTDADSICGGNEPAISSAQKYEDTTLTNWTKTINAGDILAFNVDSCDSITRVSVVLKVKKI